MSTGPPTEQPLLPFVAQNRDGALRDLMRRYEGLVWSIARRMSQRESDAEEAMQEIFVDLWRSAHRFDPNKASEKTFVAMIARRRLIDRLRKQSRRPEHAMGNEDQAATTNDPQRETNLDRSESTRLALEAFRQLRPEQQQVLRLSIQAGMTHDEVSAALSMPLGTVKTHARRGLQRVRSLLAERFGEEATA